MAEILYAENYWLSIEIRDRGPCRWHVFLMLLSCIKDFIYTWHMVRRYDFNEDCNMPTLDPFCTEDVISTQAVMLSTVQGGAWIPAVSLHSSEKAQAPRQPPRGPSPSPPPLFFNCIVLLFFCFFHSLCVQLTLYTCCTAKSPAIRDQVCAPLGFRPHTRVAAR